MHHCANQRRPHRWVGVLIAVSLFLGGAVGGSVVYLHRHEGRAPRGTILMGQDVSGMDRPTLTALVLQRAASVSLTLTVDGAPTTVPLTQIAQIDARATVEAAVSGAGSLTTHLHGVVGTREVAVRYTINKEARAALVSQLSNTLRDHVVEPAVTWNEGSGGFTASPGRVGDAIDPDDLDAALDVAARELANHTAPVSIRRAEPTVSAQEADSVAQSATALLGAELSVTVDGAVHTASKAQKASWIDFPVNEGRIVPTVSQERVRAWVTSLSAPEERKPVNAINDVDSAGTVLQLARPGKSGRKAGNIEPVTAALVQGLGQGRSVSQQISWNEVPHSTESRVVPNGPERFAYQAKAGEKWIDVNLTDSTLTAYEGQKVVYGPILINHGGVGHETITGTYKIYLRYQAQDMGCTPEWPYCERGVPWVSYWHSSYALHGAPWVKEFGIGTDESSHGCINIPVPDAQAIWQWSEIGTTVVTHY